MKNTWMKTLETKNYRKFGRNRDHKFKRKLTELRIIPLRLWFMNHECPSFVVFPERYRTFVFAEIKFIDQLFAYEHKFLLLVTKKKMLLETFSYLDFPFINSRCKHIFYIFSHFFLVTMSMHVHRKNLNIFSLVSICWQTLFCDA